MHKTSADPGILEPDIEGAARKRPYQGVLLFPSDELLAQGTGKGSFVS
jgi:hypothetical protein